MSRARGPSAYGGDVSHRRYAPAVLSVQVSSDMSILSWTTCPVSDRSLFVASIQAPADLAAGPRRTFYYRPIEGASGTGKSSERRLRDVVRRRGWRFSEPHHWY